MIPRYTAFWDVNHALDHLYTLSRPVNKNSHNSLTLTLTMLLGLVQTRIRGYMVIELKSNEDMILVLAGQFKQLSHEPEKFSSNPVEFT